ncbi:DEAD/DEAH box helicase [Tessaracoccus palaemonis]|uniref:DEAD/DEAH box helicase n=1 Tax=Tessaracoccus palaemonis TaxID=2829499 RepID=UPI00210244C4|nr:DEAD/DEAH box helicase [Tessaracoccus palaemonis]
MEFDWVLARDEVTAVSVREPRDGVGVAWPAWLAADTVARIESAGVPEPWAHQAEFADALFRGSHAMICTATGSGKTLGYLMPVLAACVDGTVGSEATSSRRRLTRSRHTAIYLAPTKALAHDQARAAAELGPASWRISTLDGDSDEAERRFARDHASYVLTNPDMLHFSVLPNHQRWSRLLGSLRYIVIDEAHRYQGVFGAHVAQVIRRLRRLAAMYGAEPIVALSSATAPNAAEFAASLAGVDEVTIVEEDTSPAGRRTVALWRPADSLRGDTAFLLSSLSDEGRQTIAFVPSRQGAELVSLAAQELAKDPARIASYRGGYLAIDRRGLEAALHSGELGGLASTNALELGVDIAGMDAVLVSGYPGKLASFWQQAGRAGRRGQDALVVLLGREDPLDVYLLEHPELVFDAPVEAAILHPENPRVLGPHLAAAAQERPLTIEDARWFGPTIGALLDTLATQGVLRNRAGRYFWTRPDRAVDYINLRSIGERPLDIIERDTGRVVGMVDVGAADRTVHPGAVYLHQGESFLVESLDEEDHQAIVVAGRPRYYTQPQESFDIQILGTTDSRPLGRTTIHRGDVRLDSQVLAYLRRDEVTHEVWDTTTLELPRRQMITQAVWWTVPPGLLGRLGWDELQVGAAAHAMEHTAIGLLPALAPCDRWDIGGVSTALHPDTGVATIFVHDGMTGGSGFAYRGYDVAELWLRATLDRLTRCPCADGCPACVVSPKCGNQNQVLNKADATELLALLLDQPLP